MRDLKDLIAEVYFLRIKLFGVTSSIFTLERKLTGEGGGVAGLLTKVMDFG